MSATARIGSAMAAGYVLGRFKKLRLAFIVAGALANKNVRSSATGLLSKGTGGVGSALGVQSLGDQVRGQLVGAGKAAAMSVAASQIDKVSDRLHERSSSLTGQDESEQGDQDEYDDQPDDEYEDQADDEYDEQPEDEYDEDESDVEDDDDEPEDVYDEDDEAAEDGPDDEAGDDAGDEDESRGSSTRHRSARRRRSAAPVGGA